MDAVIDPGSEQHAILAGIEDAVVRLDERFSVLWANPAAERALRSGRLEPGARWADLWTGADLPPDIASITAASPGGIATGTETPWPDGRFRLTRAVSLAPKDAEPGGYLLFAHDTTERRYSIQLHDATRRIIEAGLKTPDTDSLYRAIHGIISEIMEAENFYIALYDSDTDLISFPYYVDRYDWQPEPRHPGRGMTELVLRSGVPTLLTEADMTRLISSGKVDLIGVLSKWWLGVPLTVEDRIVGVMTVQGYSSGASMEQRQKDALLTLAGSAALVIEKRRSEESLSESETRYRTLAERASDGIVLVFDGRLQYGNGYIHQVLGFDPSETAGRSFVDFVAPSEREKLLDWHIRRLGGEDLPQIYETVLLDREGREIPFELNATLITEKGVTGILAILRNSSERRRIEEERRLLERQIQHTQKLESLGVLAGGIAHDFNNLLMGILGNAGLALMELPQDSPVRRTIERLETAALRAAELTNQLLAYSGRGKFLVEPVILNGLIEEMVNLLQAAVPKNVVLRLDLSHELPDIEGDATQLRQVVMNLIINAAEAIGERSGVITITTGTTVLDRSYLSGTYMDEDLPEGVYVYLEVSDTGCGMDDRTRARIFDPFFTTKFTGRGLGLAAVIGIVRGHHGTMKVYSEPSRGSSFKVLIPALGEAAAPADGIDGNLHGLAGSTVMVVDDEESVRTVAALTLERCGFRVLRASDGREALEVFRTEAPLVDLVLLDMTMPHLNGEETFREMRRLRPDVKVILSSGYNEMDAAGRFAGKGLTGFIQKPYRPVDLIARVRSALSREATPGGGRTPPGEA